MKPARQLFLGIIIFLVGFGWLLSICNNLQWWAENIKNEITLGAITVSSLIMMVGGLIIILSHFDKQPPPVG